MNLLNMIMNAQGGGAVEQLASRFGLDQSQVTAALSHLVPALSAGVQNNIAQEGGMERLLGALANGNHQQYLDNPVDQPQGAIDDGNGILSHLFGSKDVSRQVAQQASAQTGIGSEILKQMLPIVATMVMGSLSRGAMSHVDAATENAASSGMGNMSGILGQMLDHNKDGSITDDVMGYIGNLFKR